MRKTCASGLGELIGHLEKLHAENPQSLCMKVKINIARVAGDHVSTALHECGEGPAPHVSHVLAQDVLMLPLDISVPEVFMLACARYAEDALHCQLRAQTTDPGSLMHTYYRSLDQPAQPLNAVKLPAGGLHLIAFEQDPDQEKGMAMEKRLQWGKRKEQVLTWACQQGAERARRTGGCTVQ